MQLVAAFTVWTRLSLASQFTASGLLLMVFWGNWLSDNLYSPLGERFLQSNVPCHSVSVLVQSFWGTSIFWGARNLRGQYATSFLFMFEMMWQLPKKHRNYCCQVWRAVSLFPPSIQLIGHVMVPLSPAVQGLGWVIWTCMKAEEHSGGDCHCVCSMSTWDGNEFWEISFL